MSLFLPIGGRVKEERERLGFNQTDFAEAAGITRKTLYGYESGERSPDAACLNVWSALGLDVLYVVTGQRHPSMPATAPAISQGDRILLDNFHAAPAQVQQGVRTTLGAFSDSSGPTPGKRKRAA